LQEKGWNSEEVMGMHYSDLNLVPKDELARIKGTTDIILHSNETVVILERNYCHKNGSLLFCRWHNSILRDSNNNLISIFSIVEDISHLKKVQENLRKSEERFELAVAGSKDGIWEWNIENDLAYFSPRCQEMIGEEFDTHISAMEAFVKHVHLDDIADTLNSYKLHLLERKEMHVEYRLKIAVGSYHWFLVKGQAVWNDAGKPIRMVGSLSDIHDKKLMEVALENSESKFNLVTDHITDIVNLIDRNGFIKYSNQSIFGILGYHPEELLSVHFLSLVHPDEHKSLSDRFDIQINAKGHGNLLEFRLRAKDGAYISFEGIGNVQFHHPSLQSIIMISRGSTIRKKAETEKQTLIQELTKNNADLKQFSYIVSHNLRGPLTNLISMTKLLDMDTIKDERSLNLLNVFKTTTMRLNETLNHLIHILLVKNNTNIEIKELDFKKELDQVTQSIEAVIEASAMEIESDFSDAPTVFFNPAYLESIFQNLITNSIRYRSPNRNPRVKIKTFKIQQETHLEFTDNGIGFDMALVKNKIFGLHQNFHHHPESRGIGLYLIHAQITSLGGRISVTSKIDTGTVFSIVFKPE